MKKLSFLFLLFLAFNGKAQNAVITSPAATVCIGNSVTLSSSTSDPGNTVIVSSDWHIFGPDNFVLTGITLPGTDFSFVPELPGSYSVTLINQHEDMTNAASNTANFITVYALPEAHFTLDVSVACLGIPLVSTATNASSHPAGSYMEGNNSNGWAINGFQWSANSEIAYTTTYAEEFSATVTNPTSVSLVVTDAFGCQSLPYTEEITVQQPSASFVAPASVCNGSPVQLNSTSNGTIFNYRWIVDGVAQAPEQDPAFNPNWFVSDQSQLPLTHQISLIVEDDLGCRDTSLSLAVTVKAAPEADFTVTLSGTAEINGNTVNCPPVIASFTDESFSAAPITSWNWSLVNPDMLLSTQQNLQGVQFLYPGTFDMELVVTNQDGCTDTLLHDDFLVIYGPLADVSVNQTGNLNFMEYSFNVTNLSNVSAISWDLGNGETVTGDMDGFIYVYTAAGAFTPRVTVTDDMGCTVVYGLGQIVTGINGIKKLTSGSPAIYPDPASDYIYFGEETQAEILDLNGKMMPGGLIVAGTGKIDISRLQPGIYFLKAGNSMYRFQKI